MTFPSDKATELAAAATGKLTSFIKNLRKEAAKSEDAGGSYGFVNNGLLYSSQKLSPVITTMT